MTRGLTGGMSIHFYDLAQTPNPNMENVYFCEYYTKHLSLSLISVAPLDLSWRTKVIAGPYAMDFGSSPSNEVCFRSIIQYTP